jgi:hypothetical protein
LNDGQGGVLGRAIGGGDGEEALAIFVSGPNENGQDQPGRNIEKMPDATITYNITFQVNNHFIGEANKQLTNERRPDWVEAPLWKIKMSVAES